jgi:hypothetical protein
MPRAPARRVEPPEVARGPLGGQGRGGGVASAGTGDAEPNRGETAIDERITCGATSSW